MVPGRTVQVRGSGAGGGGTGVGGGGWRNEQGDKGGASILGR